MIKSSFKKVQKPTVSHKSYFGHPDLDSIFQNSLSKGHLMVMQEDHPSTNYLSLCRYFISHHYNEAQASIVFDRSNKWQYLVSPPLNKDDKSQQKQTNKSQIAWRYDHMNIKMNNLTLDERIIFTDLSKEINQLKPQLIHIHQYPNQSIKDIYKHIEQTLANSFSSGQDTSTKKLLLQSLPAYIYQDTQFHKFLQAVRCLTRSSHLFTLITVPPIISTSTRDTLIKYSDYYVQINKVGKGYKDFTGSLTILKQVQACNLRSQFRGVSVWGLKSTRKQLRIESLYEQPFEQQYSRQKNDF